MKTQRDKPETLTDAEREEFEERAGIIQFGDLVPRESAERLARQIILANRLKRARIDPSAI